MLKIYYEFKTCPQFSSYYRTQFSERFENPVERMHKILNKYLLLAIPSEIRKVQG